MPNEPALLQIVVATLAGGATSVILAMLAGPRVHARTINWMVSFAVGVLLATAFLDVLPQAFGRSENVHGVSLALLCGLMLFFLLQKAALWRHSHHEDHPSGHAHGGGHAHHGTVTMILVGDAFHNFVDGMLIAAAFLADASLGVTTTLAVIAHEIPQELGDFMILLDNGFSRGKALFWNLASSMGSVLGGVAGYFLLNQASAAIPYALAIAAASLIYVAMADLMPAMQRRWDARATVSQITLIGAGIAVMAGVHHV